MGLPLVLADLLTPLLLVIGAVVGAGLVYALGVFLGKQPVTKARQEAGEAGW